MNGLDSTWNQMNPETVVKDVTPLKFILETVITGERFAVAGCRPEDRHQVRARLVDGVDARRRRDARRKVPARHEDAAPGRLRPLRDPPQRRYVPQREVENPWTNLDICDQNLFS